MVVLLGANGAGKTTTLACAQGLLKPTRGTVRLLGENPLQADPELRAKVGIMLQDGGLPNAMHPIPLLEHISTMYTDPYPVEELAERLGIDAFNGTTIRRLSGGQKQRVSLAAALIGRPDVLFLDEPSAGLDPQSRNVVFDIIREQRELGTAIVLTTHLIDDAQKLADYVYIIENGATVQEGTVSELIASDGTNRLQYTLDAPTPHPVSNCCPHICVPVWSSSRRCPTPRLVTAHPPCPARMSWSAHYAPSTWRRSPQRSPNVTSCRFLSPWNRRLLRMSSSTFQDVISDEQHRTH